jgi:isoleucyl-tRNA synthetase
MRGYCCHRKGGWDTHGLPVEVEVCKDIGIHSKEEIEAYGIEPFVKKCIESVFRYTKQWEDLTRRLGFWINLDDAYVTYRRAYVESVWWALKTFHDKGLLFQGHKVVWWWPQGGTALSSGEVGQGYREVDDPSVYVCFPLLRTEDSIRRGAEQQGLQLGDDHKTSLLAWTTTPWTLPSNIFAAVHSDVVYAFLTLYPKDKPEEPLETVVLAKDRIPVLEQNLFANKGLEYRQVFECSGAQLEGIQYEPPFPDAFYNARPEEENVADFGYAPSPDDGPRPPHLEWKDVRKPLRGGIQAYTPVAWRVVEASFVTLDQGTGIVHIAPAFGEDDYDLWRKENYRFAGENAIKLFCAVKPDGTFTSQYEEQPDGTVTADMKDYAGRFVKEADRDLIRDLKDRGLLLHQEQYRHEYPFCWRADQDPLIQYARKSWFIRTTEFKDRFLANNDKIQWLPDHIREGRFGNFLATNVDWALSRERYWGTPLPIWQCEKTGHQEAIASYDELLAKPGVQGADVWENAKKADPDLPDDLRVHKPYIDAVTYQSPKDPAARMRRVTEVIDCWFDSGCMPFAQWGYPHTDDGTFQERFPADFISEALDQTRGWFYTLLAISTMLFADENDNGDHAGTFAKDLPHPFKSCIVLGLMLGEDGKKLSKSLRNFKEPSYIFEREGADAMRWTLLSAQPPWTSVRFQEEVIATNQREFLIRLYNVYSFFVIYANIDGFNPADGVMPPAGEMGELDQWMLSELHAATRDIIAAMDAYENYPAAQRLSDLLDALSNWYVRRSRNRYWKSQKDHDKQNAYWTLWTCLETICRLSAPFCPFLAEAIYQNLVRTPFADGSKPESIHLCDYPEPDENLINEKLSTQMAVVRQIASLGRSARADAKLKVRQPLSVVEIVLADPSHQAWLESHAKLIEEELNVHRVEFVADAGKYVDYQIKPNFKIIGPKFGKLGPQIKKALASADGSALYRTLADAGTISLDVNGESVELDNEAVQIALAAKEGWAAAQGKDAVIILATEITDDLRAEGMIREFVHHVQGLRKELDLAYTDRILIGFMSSDEFWTTADHHADYIKTETLAVELVREVLPDSAKAECDIDGNDITITVARSEASA